MLKTVPVKEITIGEGKQSVIVPIVGKSKDEIIRKR